MEDRLTRGEVGLMEKAIEKSRGAKHLFTIHSRSQIDLIKVQLLYNVKRFIHIQGSSSGHDDTSGMEEER